MYTFAGEPTLTAQGHEIWAEVKAGLAEEYRRDAEAAPGARQRAAFLWLAEEAEGASKGHLFRALELRYDARGGMTRAQAAEQVIDVLTEIMEAGAKPGRERDDMAEEQGETWDEPRKGDGRC